MNLKLLNCMIAILALALPACQPAEFPGGSEFPSPVASLEAGWIPMETLTPPASQASAEPAAASAAGWGDAAGGYQLTLPPDWAAVTLEPESIRLAGADNPSLAQTLEHIRETGFGLERAFLYSRDPSQVRAGQPAQILVYFVQHDLIAFVPMSELVQMGAEQLQKLDADMTITSTSVARTASGLDIGILEATERLSDNSSAPIALYDKIVIFKTSSGAAILMLRTHPDLQEAIVPLFDRMIETVRIS